MGEKWKKPHGKETARKRENHKIAREKGKLNEQNTVQHRTAMNALLKPSLMLAVSAYDKYTRPICNLNLIVF